MDQNIVYSSELACDNITRRELRSFDDITTRLNGSKFTQDLLYPLVHRIATSGRLKRGLLKGLVGKVAQQLKVEQGVIDVEVDTYSPSKLSTNEGARVAFVALMSEGEHWLKFCLSEAVMTRKEVTVRTSEADIHIHRHAMSRYMQRERQPVSEMYKQLMEAVRASSLIGEAASTVEGRQVAIAMGDGLLLGRLRLQSWAQHPAYIEKLAVSSAMADHSVEQRSDMEDTPQRIVIEMMTYVDHNSLTDSRECLRDLLREFQARRSFESKVLFDATYFKSAIVPVGLAGQAQERLYDAVEEAERLVQSEPWRCFVATAPAQFCP